MYLRHTTRRKDGKVHTYWQLVRSVRMGRRVVQQTVAQLGELDAQGRARAKALAQALVGGLTQPELFTRAAVSEEVVPVRLDRVRLERGRRFGDVWLGWTLWRALRLDTVLETLLPAGREAVPWATMAAVLVLARLCEPASELHIAETWYRQTALEDLLGVPADLVNDDRLYRALDRLLPHKRALESHLVARLRELFALDYDLLLYDVTSTYFEGQAVANPLAHRGYSRDHRPDCKQVCIALVVTCEGLPLGYEVFAGNRTDVTTVEEIVGTMEARYGLAQRIWVMDRGMTSEENLTWLRASGRRYLLGTPKSELRKWARALTDERDWTTVREGVAAKACLGPTGTETFLLVRSVERREKEQAMHTRFGQRIESGVARLARRLSRVRRPLERGPIDRQIGRLLAHNSRAAGRYVIDVVADPTTASGLRVTWASQPEWDDWVSAKAATCCAPTFRTGVQRTCGAPMSNSPTPKPPSGFRKATWLCVPSGINAPTESRLTFWCASWPMCCGRPWNSGNSGLGWATVRARSWKNSGPFRAPMSCCRGRMAARCGCAVSCGRIGLRPCSWIAWESIAPSDSA